MPPKPIELTDIQRQEVETLAALLNQEQIADYLGIGRTTFHRLMQRDPDVAERYKRGKAKAIAHVANGLLQKARSGCTTSSIFYLKTQAGWRETERLEHVAAEAAPADPRDTAKRLQVFLERIAERQREEAMAGESSARRLAAPTVDVVTIDPPEEF